VVEECPSPAIDDATRERLCAAAVALTQAVRYRGAGTIEFLLAPDGRFYFLEMNTRLQVEHPATELVTGIDLVRTQVRIAAEGQLPFGQDDVRRAGHAIEARVYAEDPAHGFLPQAGEARRAHWPRGPFCRVDHGIETGDDVPVHYDPILAKIVCYGRERSHALIRLTAALDEARVHGVVTNLPFLRALARARGVLEATYDTEWIEREFLGGFVALATAPVPELALAALAVAEALGAGGTLRPDARDGASAPSRGPADAFRAAGRWRHPGLD
jgi:acetyl/propionyl-CoA carboxylase alpha subunit